MAVEIFSGGYIRPTHKITVTRAEFQQREGGGGGGDGAGTGTAAGAPAGAPGGNGKRARVSHAQVKVAQSAMRQALSWNEDDDIGVSGKQALKIVVMEGMFSPEDFNDSSFSDELEADIAEGCGRCGDIDKITVFSKNPRGVAIVKFTTSFASQECIKMMDGRFFGGRKIRCYFWDGVTNFTSEGSLTLQKMEEEEKEEKERLDEFGDWLEQGQSELPPELRLRVEH